MTIPYTKFEGLFIGGQWIGADDSEDIINPATEETIGRAPIGSAAHADDAIGAARAAFDKGEWPSLPTRARADHLRRFLAEIEKHSEAIKTMMIAEGGITRQLVEGMHFPAPIKIVRDLITRSECQNDTYLPIETSPDPFNPDGGELIGGGVVVREPVGVVAAISPYNAPFLVNLTKIAPALLAGNSIVLKPSPFTPFSALLFGEFAKAAGLPDGVFNVITGGVEVGERLSADERVDMVTFTGSEIVGASIMAQSAPTLKKLLLELGGKSALIVREDADVMKAAMEGVFQLSVHCGQGCALATRHIVHNNIRAQYVETLKGIATTLPVGNPADAATVVGPLIRNSARERIEAFVARGRDEGATLVCGGSRPDHLDKGFFYNVTVFDDVENAMFVAQEEAFGPVGAVIGFDTDDEAVALANDSRYGLYGGIHSTDAAKAFEMARKIRTGGMVINGGLYKQMDAPFGGYKRSGLGREYGPNWLDEYTEQKSIIYPIGR